MSPRTTAGRPSTTSLAFMLTSLIWKQVHVESELSCVQVCAIEVTTHPLAPEELEGGVAVGEVVGPAEDAPPLGGQPLPRQHLQQRQQPRPVAQVLHQALDPEGRDALAQVRVDPVDERLLLHALLLV